MWNYQPSIFFAIILLESVIMIVLNTNLALVFFLCIFLPLFILYIRFNIIADNTKLIVYYGPNLSIIKSTSKDWKKNLFFFPIRKQVIHYEDIYSIYPISIHWMRDYFVRGGYGMSTGPNGDFAFITGGKTGIRITLKNGVEYVITTSRPDELTDFIRSKMK
jgi:hypothetical protein